MIVNGDGTAVLSGTPENDDVGDHPIELTVTDGFVTVSQEFSVSVINTNDAPVIDPLNTFTFNEGSSLQIDFSQFIIDVDINDFPVLSVSDYNTYSDTIGIVTIDINNFIVSFGVTDNDLSGVAEIIIYVTDGAESDSANVSIIVNPFNDNPVLTEIGDQETYEDSILYIPLSAFDVDNPYNYITFSASSENDSVTVSIPTGGTVPELSILHISETQIQEANSNAI